MRVAEQGFHPAVEAAAASQGNEGQGVVGEHPADMLLERDHRLVQVFREGAPRPDERSHADPGDDIHRQPGFAHGPDDAGMREPARAAAAENEADFAPQDVADDALEVVLPVAAHVKVSVEPAFPQPAHGAARPERAGRMHQDEGLSEAGVSGPFFVKDFRLRFRQIRHAARDTEGHDLIRLPDAAPGPVGEAGIGHIDHEPAARFLTVQPRLKAKVLGAAFLRQCDARGAEQRVRPCVGEQLTGRVPGQRFAEASGDFLQGPPVAGGNEKDVGAQVLGRVS